MARRLESDDGTKARLWSRRMTDASSPPPPPVADTPKRRGRLLAAAVVLLSLSMFGSVGPSGAATTYQPVVIANGWSPSDVGTAAPLAASLGGSVLYSNKDSLGSPTVGALEELKPSEIILVGGTAVLSQKIVDQLGRVVPNVPIERLAGRDRIDTAAKGALRALGRPVQKPDDSGAAKTATTVDLPSSYATRDSDGNQYFELRLRVGTDIRPGIWQARRSSRYSYCIAGLGNDAVDLAHNAILINGAVHLFGESQDIALHDGDMVILQDWLSNNDCTITHVRD